MSVTSKRLSGVLAHVTSLPGPGPQGTTGTESLDFVDRLADAGQSIWQMLPVHPPDGFGSPYSSPSAFAGHRPLAGAIDGDTEGYDAWRETNAEWVDDWALFTTIHEMHDGAPWQKWPAALRRRAR